MWYDTYVGDRKRGFKIEHELALLRLIMMHRRIGTVQIAAQLHISNSTVQRALRGEMPAWLDRIDTAITQITDARGGIPQACCGQAAHDDMVRLLGTHPATREAFPNWWRV